MGISTTLYEQVHESTEELVTDGSVEQYDTGPSYEPVDDLPTGSAADPFL